MKKKKKIFGIIATVLVLAMLLLTACGGGGGGTASVPDDPTPDDPVTPLPTEPGPTPPPSTAALKVNSDTLASHSGASVVFNSAGTSGLAVWQENSGPSVRLLYSLYTPGAWQPEAELTQGGKYAGAATNGTTFMVAYQKNGMLYFRIYDGSWGAETLVSGTNYSISPVIVSNGTGYAVAWVEWESPTYNLYANIYNGSAWDGPALIDAGANFVNSPRIASNGAGYAVTWYQNDGTENSIYANIYNGSAWGGAILLENSDFYSNYPQIASNGTGYGVTWQQYDGSNYNIYANIYNGTSWGGATPVENSNNYPVAPQIASNGVGYAVAWSQYDSAAFTYSIYANIYNGGAWGTAALVESLGFYADSPRIASNGTGYAVTWIQDDGAVDNIHANIHDGIAWGGAALIESGAGSAGTPFIVRKGPGYAAVWEQPGSGDASSLFIALYGTGWSTETSLVSGTHRSASTDPALATNSTGTTWLFGRSITTAYRMYTPAGTATGRGARPRSSRETGM